MTEETLLSRLGTAVWKRRHPEWAEPPSDRIGPRLVISARTLPRYAVDQAALALDRRRNGVTGRPWITADSMRMLDGLLRPTDRALEFGSGGSTEWFARRVQHLWSVEAADHWYQPLSARLAAQGIVNVDLELVSSAALGRDTAEHRRRYVNSHPELATQSVDFVFVDGEYRDACAHRGLALLRPGGLIVLDNANTYLPSPGTRAPWRVGEPASPLWRDFLDRVRGWRHVWTTNGAWDTALWIKPCAADSTIPERV